MPTTHLLYLHGFRSSPRSTKAQMVAERVRVQHPDLHWWCPQLPPSPREAAELVSQGIADWPHQQMAVIGSSLGGYYATWVAERQSCRAVVLNPAVDPARDLAAQVGQQTAWHDPAESFLFHHEYVSELRALHAGPLADPARYLAVIAKGDEVLDWREMTARYAGAHIKLLEGGNHALSDFAEHLDEVLGFVGL
jgi:predicted esterase YcpF (UPF0227 family)